MMEQKALLMCRCWMAATAFMMIISSTNSYLLLHDSRVVTTRRRTSHSSSFNHSGPQATGERRPGNARGEPPILGAANSDSGDIANNNERRKLIGSVARASASASLGLLSSFNLLLGIPRSAGAAVSDEGGLEVIKTPSGLKYLDLVPGTGRTPRYGELLSIAYTGYIKLPSGNVKKYKSEPQKFDQVTDGYLVKHGNGKTVAGLDEGLHTMREGGTRRILIPPKLGFVDIGLGPMPESPWDRDRLNRLLDQMVELSGGTLIYEVTLKSIIIDEADQGYYEDETISPENFAKLRANMQQQAAEAKLAQEAMERQPKNADKVM